MSYLKTFGILSVLVVGVAVACTSNDQTALQAESVKANDFSARGTRIDEASANGLAADPAACQSGRAGGCGDTVDRSIDAASPETILSDCVKNGDC